MTRSEYARLYTIAIVLFVLIFGAHALHSYAQVKATPDQLATLRSFGITSDLVDPKTVAGLTGGCATNPYPDLEKYKSGSNVLITPSAGSGDGTNLKGGVNSVLACRLLKFLQYAESTKGCRFSIISAYRSSQTQANACQQMCGNSNGCSVKRGDKGDCGAPGGSCHQYGLAVDIKASDSCMSWAHSYLGYGSPAAGAQDQKIFFPIGTDNVHIQCIENKAGGCRNITPAQSCDGTGTGVSPDLAYTPGPTTPTTQGAQTPMQALQQALTPPTPTTCQTGYTLTNGQCYPSQTTATQSPYSYASPTSVATTTFDTSYLNGPQLANNSSTSAIDLINSIANPTAATTTATGTPITLIAALGNSVQLAGNQNPNDTQASRTVSGGAPSGSQTFISQDLSQTSAYAPGASTFGILQNLQQVLLKIMQLLTPFGRPLPTPPTQPANSATVFLE